MSIDDGFKHEPFATTWLGICLQLFVVVVLVYLTWLQWAQ